MDEVAIKKAVAEALAGHGKTTEEHRKRQLDLIRETVCQSVTETVNGKIITLSKTVSDFIVRAEPAVRLFENITWGQKVAMRVIVMLGGVVGLLLGLLKLIGVTSNN